MPEPSAFEVELAIEKLKNHKSPGIDQIPVELIKAGGRTLRCAIHKLIISIWNREELPEEWKGSIIVPIHKKGNKTDCNNFRGISLLPTTYKSLSNILLSRLIPYAEDRCGKFCPRRDSISTPSNPYQWTMQNIKFLEVKL